MTRKAPPPPASRPDLVEPTASRAGVAGTRYPLARVQQLLGLSRSVIRRLVDAGFVVPQRGPGHRFSFSFEDLVLLRGAHALIEANVPPRRIVAALAKLKRSLPADASLAGVKLGVVGAQVVVRDRAGLREAHSGQRVIDFDIAPAGAPVAPVVLPTRSARPAMAAKVDLSRHESETADDGVRARDAAAPSSRASAAPSMRQGLAAEARGDAAAAEAAYRRALDLDPVHLDACLNLGALLSDRGRSAEALPLYRAAFAQGLDHALLHYNHAIALEDTGQPRAALVAYARALALDPACADAHFNAGRLLEQLGDARGALRHFNAYRRAQRGD